MELENLLKNGALPPSLRINSLALVALGVRPLSMVTIPAELPQGDVLSREIDATYQRLLNEGTNGTLLQRFYFKILSQGRPLVEYKKTLLSRAYDEVVKSQPSYKTLLKTVEQLKLPLTEYEVRPSIRELYICSSYSVKERLDHLLQQREEIKREAWANATPQTPYSMLVYPEEQVIDYVKKLGEILAYPSCCVKRYVADRKAGEDATIRAAHQLAEVEQAGAEVNPLAYFTKNFVPCSPTCQEATARGQECFDRLSTEEPEAAHDYMDLVQDNKSRVTHYPAM